ncbi:hypothetical protein K2X33_09950 [bacterium]|nr:hypothetical protein [bacterium]
MLRGALFLSLFLCPLVEATTIPADGPDLTLIGSDSPRVFFESKGTDAACVSDLSTAKTNYRKGYAELQKLKAARTTPVGTEDAAIEAKFKEVDAIRDNVLVLLEKCGECSTNKLTTSKAGPGLEWFISNGSCQLPIKDKAALKTAFDKVRASLLHTANYSKKAFRGFDNILDFQMIGPDMKPVGKDVPLPETGFNLLISVRGPGVALQYFIDGSYKSSAVDPSKRVGMEENQFALEFSSADANRMAQVAFSGTVNDYTASGIPVPMTGVPLAQVQGKWYLTDDGYIRYYTAAVIPTLIIPASKRQKMLDLGRKILIDSLFDLSERAEWDLAGSPTP